MVQKLRKEEDDMSNTNFQNSLQRIPQNIPPVWMMRQAGRYHKHYQNLRSKYSFMQLCKEPELAAEVAFGPVDEFDFDVSILFSDLLFPLEALGQGLEYTDSGPRLGWNLTDETFPNLRPVDDAITHLEFQKKAMQLTRQKIPSHKSVIGFVGGPWTLFCYSSMGKHEGGLTTAKKSISLREKFFPIITDLLIKNIQLQFEGGAEIVMIFDTAAGELSNLEFEKIILPSLKILSDKFPKKLGYYSKNTTEQQVNSVLKSIPNLTGIGVDHRLNITSTFQNNQLGFTQGNFDQSLLFLEKDSFLKILMEYIQPIKDLSLEDRKGWVCGLGHGVLPKTPESNVKYFVETIRRIFS
jgi:uroporphyrinogen decarboxylase